MNELVAALKIALANTFVFYFKAHSYHWNVEGKNFSEYHEFFSGIYTDVFGSVDTLAEYIRISGEYAPASLSELYSYKTIEEDASKPTNCEQMFLSMLMANQQMLETLNKLFDVAESQNKQGLMDFVATRIDFHEKQSWMLKSYIKER